MPLLLGLLKVNIFGILGVKCYYSLYNISCGGKFNINLNISYGCVILIDMFFYTVNEKYIKG